MASTAVAPVLDARPYQPAADVIVWGASTPGEQPSLETDAIYWGTDVGDRRGQPDRPNRRGLPAASGEEFDAAGVKRDNIVWGTGVGDRRGLPDDQKLRRPDVSVSAPRAEDNVIWGY